MAGRGRGATLPAWMTNQAENGNGGAPLHSGDLQMPSGGSERFHDATTDRRRDERRGDRGNGAEGGHGKSEDRKRRHRSNSRSRSRDRRDERRPNRDSDRRDRGRRSSSRTEHNSTSIPDWKPRKMRGSSNFDKKPPPGVELPPIGVVTPINGVPNSYFSFSNNPLQMVKESRTSSDKVLLA